ncbi:hypothetical protein [Longimycelium tulufanense]|nr:hypothetical protein [Longimycelium tulufanense]
MPTVLVPTDADTTLALFGLAPRPPSRPLSSWLACRKRVDAARRKEVTR